MLIFFNRKLKSDVKKKDILDKQGKENLLEGTKMTDNIKQNNIQIVNHENGIKEEEEKVRLNTN